MKTNDLKVGDKVKFHEPYPNIAEYKGIITNINFPYFYITDILEFKVHNKLIISKLLPILENIKYKEIMIEHTPVIKDFKFDFIFNDESKWENRYRPYQFKIGEHWFYSDTLPYPGDFPNYLEKGKTYTIEIKEKL